MIDDITFCASGTCEKVKCFRHPSNIKDTTIPHSFAMFEGTDECEYAEKKGDLISREALRNDFMVRLKACKDWIDRAKDEEIKIRAKATEDFCNEVILTIDRAPTSEPTFKPIAVVHLDNEKLEECKDKIIEQIKSGELVLSTEPERPKGKWGEVFHYQGWNYHKCSNCHLSLKLSDYDNFCPNCGADMRGEET